MDRVVSIVVFCFVFLIFVTFLKFNHGLLHDMHAGLCVWMILKFYKFPYAMFVIYQLWCLLRVLRYSHMIFKPVRSIIYLCMSLFLFISDNRCYPAKFLLYPELNKIFLSYLVLSYLTVSFASLVLCALELSLETAQKTSKEDNVLRKYHHYGPICWADIKIYLPW